jgi:urease accessory protein
VNECRKIGPAVTLLPGVLIARYLGDSTEEAFRQFSILWTLMRPAVAGRDAVIPRIWQT